MVGPFGKPQFALSNVDQNDIFDPCFDHCVTLTRVGLFAATTPFTTFLVAEAGFYLLRFSTAMTDAAALTGQVLQGEITRQVGSPETLGYFTGSNFMTGFFECVTYVRPGQQLAIKTISGQAATTTTWNSIHVKKLFR
jgi:hypothetical protein